MKLSIFTPTHNPIHILATYNSLIGQNNLDKHSWEWAILLNGSATEKNIPEELKNNPNIRLIQYDNSSDKIGALKYSICKLLEGDLFVELDHDDLLTPNAFNAIIDAAKGCPNGFYYSDFINIKQNGEYELYSKNHGWERYPFKIDNTIHTANKAFLPNARSIYQIFYAPNHVRVWSRYAYEKAGGHDITLSVADDHDLVCKTYLAGVPFVWIQEPLYIYRRWNNNTFVARNKDVQTIQAQNGHKYIHRLIIEECLRDNFAMIDLGRSEKCHPAFTPTSFLESDPVSFFNSYKENSVGCFLLVDVLNYIPKDDIVPCLNQLYTALRPGGWIISATPAIDDGTGKTGYGAFQNPSFNSYWCENNFWYFTQQKYARTLQRYKGRFQQVRLFTSYPSKWHRENRISYVYSDMCALKGQRQPGKREI